MENNFVKKFTANVVVDTEGNRYESIRNLAKKISVDRHKLSWILNTRGYYKKGDVYYYLLGVSDIDTIKKIEDANNDENGIVKVVEVEKPRKDDDEYNKFLAMKDIESLPFEKYDFRLTRHKNGTRYCVALFSDLHYEQRVEKESVFGMNEYNMEIAQKRVMNYFSNLALCLNSDHVDDLIFGCLGDLINGTIHQSYFANNECMPLEAILKVQSLLYNGLEFLCNNTSLRKIMFVGVIGNHSRTTEKTWSAGAYKMSYEYLLYKNVEAMCQVKGLPVEFIIPAADKAIVDTTDGKRFVFEHGDCCKTTGAGVAGIYPALARYTLKEKRVLNQDKIYMGHFHTCCSISGCAVNGSIVGWDNYAMRNSLSFEVPSQLYEVYDSERGLLMTRQIYCD